jgi:predicted nucleic-acid-binding protein
MIGLDTNILIRYIAKDDPVSGPKASQTMASLTAQNPGWVSITAMAEMVWVLTRRYRLNRKDLANLLKELLARPEIIVENEEVVKGALDLYNAGAGDFSDCLVSCSGKIAGCAATLTFDRKAARDASITLA